MMAALVTSLAINILLTIAFVMTQKVIGEMKIKLKESQKKNIELVSLINKMQLNRKTANEKININHGSIDNALAELSKQL